MYYGSYYGYYGQRPPANQVVPKCGRGENPPPGYIPPGLTKIYEGWVQCPSCGAYWYIQAYLDPGYTSQDQVYCGVIGCRTLVYDPYQKGHCGYWDKVRVYVTEFQPPKADGYYTCSLCGRVTGYKYPTAYGPGCLGGRLLVCSWCGQTPYGGAVPTGNRRVFYWRETETTTPPPGGAPQPTEPSSVNVTVSGRTFTVTTVPATASIQRLDIRIYYTFGWWQITVRNLSTTSKSITWDGRNNAGRICTPGRYQWEAYVTAPTGRRWGPFRGWVRC
jgi:hypothetical protein